MPDTLPSAEALSVALRSLLHQIPWYEARLLIAQYRAPNRTVDALTLQILTRREGLADTWLSYGRLARRVGVAAGWKPPRKGVPWSVALSDTLPALDAEHGVRWRMRPEVVEALVRSEWVPPDPSSDLERLQRSVDDLTRVVLFLADELADARIDIDAVRRPPEKRFGALQETAGRRPLFSADVLAAVALKREIEARALSDGVEALVDHWFRDL